MIKKILNSETKTINSAAIILAVSSLVSGILGLFRDRLLASTFGASSELDIYYAAFRIPDFISTILIIGSISAAIIPLFSEYLVRSKKEAWHFFSNLLNSFLLVLIITSVLLILFVPQILHLIVPGFSGEKFDKTVELTRIMFLSPILLGLSNMVSGVLRVFKRFLITSLSPVLYNVGIIIGVIFFVPGFGLMGLAWGVVLGAVLHLLVQLPILFKMGFKPKKSLDFAHPGVLKAVKLTLPRTLGLAASQINLIVITAIGSTLSAGSIAVFNLANNLQWLPIAFIASSFSTAAFPFLALYFSENNHKRFAEEFTSIFKKILFYIMPVSLLIFVLRAQIIRIVLGTGRFGWQDTQLTAACLGIFSIGIFAYGLSLLVSKTFYALQDTKTPALVAFLSIGSNVALSYIFIWLMSFENFFSKNLIEILDLGGIPGVSVVGLCLALSVSGVIQLSLLMFFLIRKMSDLKIMPILNFIFKVILAGTGLAVASVLARDISAGFVDMRTFWGIFFQAGLAFLAGATVYVIFAFILKIARAGVLKDLIFRKNQVPPQNY